MPSPSTPSSLASTVVEKINRARSQEHSALFNGNQFTGTQRSGRSRFNPHNIDSSSYEVQVDLQHVDFAQGTLCGYLSIKGLTEDYPTLCTFFEGEIIGENYSFLTRKWDANEKIDREHWSRFPDFQQYDKVFNNDGFVCPTDSSVDFIYMRWKEIFLVPDHKVKTINGVLRVVINAR
jgi:hypothetical protein